MPELNPQLNAIVDDLADLAMNARLIGMSGQPLAADLDALVAKYRNGATPQPAATPVEPAAEQHVAPQAPEQFRDPLEVFEAIADGMDDQIIIDGLPDEARAMVGLPPRGDQPNPLDVDDDLAGLAAQIDEVGAEQLAAAAPQDLTLTMRTRDGSPVPEADVRQVAQDLQATLEAVVGPLVINDDATVHDTGLSTITLATAEDNDGSGLVLLGAGTDGFNAALPTAACGIVDVIATIGMPADLTLAEQLGMLAPELPAVPEGQHAINGVLELVEEATGVRPQAQPMFTVTYSKDNGEELTDAHVEQILAHPVSDALRRLGANQHVETTPGPDVSVKVAHFALLANDGDVDMATVALGATAYRGTFNFGGAIGVVSANAQAQLVDVEVPVDAGW